MNMRTPDSGQKSVGGGRARQIYHAGERAMLRKRIFRRLRKMNLQKLLRRSLNRGVKWLRLLGTPQRASKKRPVFVVGCNRSGTNMLCIAIGNSPFGWDYRESDFSAAFSGYYLRPDWIIERLIRLTPAPIVSFGSILDSQSTKDLLSRFEGARAIWIYRRFQDVANSCARMQWGSHLKDLIRWAAKGEVEKLGARGKHLSSDTIRLFEQLFREDLSLEEIACLYWYMRNQLYFSLELHKDPRVLLVQYEDAVLNKEVVFKRIFDFLRFPFDSAVTRDIFASSVGKNTLPSIDSAILDACNLLTSQLDEHYAMTSHLKSEEGELLPV